jgi:hypothetical protein
MDMNIHEYVDQRLEINQYFALFPTTTGECATVLPDDEIMGMEFPTHGRSVLLN